MKTLRLLLLGLLTPLLLGSTFAFDLTPDDLDYINSVSISHGSVSTSNSYSLLYDHGDSWSDTISFCVLFGNYVGSTDGYVVSAQNTSNPTFGSSNMVWGISSPYALYCRSTSARYIYFYKTFNGSYSFDYYVVKASDIFNGKLGFDVAGITSQLTACQSNLNFCKSDLHTATGSLATCQSDLTTCQSNGANCDTLYGVCQENLSGCNSDKDSLTNYNEALSTQLNECLNNQGSGVNLSGLVLNNNSLFWYLDDSLLSLPINNNLFLPLGYQGALDSGNVLYIKSIDEEEPENYYITPEDKVSIIDILSYIFVFFLGIGIIFSLIKLFKKLFTH